MEGLAETITAVRISGGEPELVVSLQPPPLNSVERSKNMDEVLENLEPVVLGPADKLTEFGWSGDDDNSRSDFWWWF